MLITREPLPRRTFLQGMGAAVALPLLDAMLPSRRLLGALSATDPTRLICIEMVHGAAGCSAYGATQNYWTPAVTGSGFDLSPPSRRNENAPAWNGPCSIGTLPPSSYIASSAPKRWTIGPPSALPAARWYD